MGGITSGVSWHMEYRCLLRNITQYEYVHIKKNPRCKSHTQPQENHIPVDWCTDANDSKQKCKGWMMRRQTTFPPSARPAFKQTMFGTTLNALSCCSTSCHFWRQVPQINYTDSRYDNMQVTEQSQISGNMKQYNIKNNISNSNSVVPFQITVYLHVYTKLKKNSILSVYIDTFKKNTYIYIYDISMGFKQIYTPFCFGSWIVGFFRCIPGCSKRCFHKNHRLPGPNIATPVTGDQGFRVCWEVWRSGNDFNKTTQIIHIL